MQKIASLASPKKRVVEQGFLEFFQDDGLERKLSVRRISIDKNALVFTGLATIRVAIRK
jgi:hypothetical protein